MQLHEAISQRSFWQIGDGRRSCIIYLHKWHPSKTTPCFCTEGNFFVQEDMLRLKASLERVQRLTAAFADAQLDTFSARAVLLGSALGLSREVQTVFTEAEIRANVTFQLSKLNTELLQICRECLGAGDYDGIVFGDAVGTLVEVESIVPGQTLADGLPCVLLVQSATGDEEARGPHACISHTLHVSTVAAWMSCHDRHLLSALEVHFVCGFGVMLWSEQHQIAKRLSPCNVT